MVWRFQGLTVWPRYSDVNWKVAIDNFMSLDLMKKYWELAVLNAGKTKFCHLIVIFPPWVIDNRNILTCWLAVLYGEAFLFKLPDGLVVVDPAEDWGADWGGGINVLSCPLVDDETLSGCLTGVVRGLSLKIKTGEISSAWLILLTSMKTASSS